MSRTAAKCENESDSERRCEFDQLNSTWGSLIDQGLRQANDTLATLAAGDSRDLDNSHEAWSLIGRAFESSASALRALKT